MTTEQIAKVCHDANKSYCQSIGDNSQAAWEDAPEWQRSSAIVGVKFCSDNPDAPPSANHDSWMKQKTEEGWKFGPVKNVEAKEHPCYLPYEELPEEQKKKDSLFKAICASLR